MCSSDLENLETDKAPAFPVGSKAISKADHMDGMMKDVEVTIAGAFKTTAYVTTYTSSESGETVKDHKWIVHEEFIDPGKEILDPGSTIVTTADHMKGMRNSLQTIESSTTTTVYMVNFTTPEGKKVTNHKWVAEEELLPL